jgi:hypothetical protein
LTIQCTPKRSFAIPKPSAQNVLPNGIVTSPPSASALNSFWPSSTVAGFSDSE